MCNDKNQILYMYPNAFYASLANHSIDVFETICTDIPPENMIKITVKSFKVERMDILLGVNEPCFTGLACSFKRSDIVTFEDPIYHINNPIPEKKKGFWIPDIAFNHYYKTNNPYYEGLVFDRPMARYSFYIEVSAYTMQEKTNFTRFAFSDVTFIKFRNNRTGLEMTFEEFIPYIHKFIAALSFALKDAFASFLNNKNGVLENKDFKEI
jgi:hypothetical protein